MMRVTRLLLPMLINFMTVLFVDNFMLSKNLFQFNMTNDKNKNKNFSLLNKIIPFVSRCTVYSFEDN
jgi:hypothetical protein